MFSRCSLIKRLTAACAPALLASSTFAANVMLTEVPDYAWYAGCFGTAGGNLMGYWDRHGLTNVYAGPTSSHLAPLDSSFFLGHSGITSLWASKAGVDGRPADLPGHMDDYWENPDAYESTGADPHVVAGRLEHTPDCLGDFMGLSQNKWADLGGEVNGNINAYAYNFWDRAGDPRVNFQPPPQGRTEVRDIQSGLRNFASFRGYDANVMSQLVDLNPTVQPGKGFTFSNLKAEIDAGYPVMLILQYAHETNRSLLGNSRANPVMHAMLAFGYITSDSTGQNFVRYHTSWASGDTFKEWSPTLWEADLPLLGVLTFHPIPKITSISRANGKVKLAWDGPASVLQDNESGSIRATQWYVVEQADEVTGEFHRLTEPAAELNAEVPETSARGFYRVRLLTQSELP